MFFFENYTITNVLIFLLVLFGLLLINEGTRRSKILSIVFYIAIPLTFTLFLWGKGESENTDGNWFAWVKTYSALAGVVGFMAIRYFKKLQTNKWALLFPALILSVNILEAVFRDFEVYSKAGVIENGLFLQGGPWNIINGIAGIISIITITGWVGIKIANSKSKDMVWADQLWFWIIAYGIWNMSYVYNCIPDRAFYAGVALIFSCTVAAFVGTKGLWLQHRAQTLALWAMFSLTFPNYSNTQYFDIVSTHAAAPKYVLAIAAILFNVGVLVYEIITIRRTKRNPLKQELYIDLPCYQEVIEANNL
ncbi:hypothetical protein KQ51_00623 [Candidatus Izimaplasma bacterium HR1]|jgi:hypothetical protein|uniref:DUF5692 family protein n=1 Tax=Candidatus Izimoplasma sp. HR1 TaxID=1541959 RepID=UPI0004F802F1|nr:hypothetical protein KQ51_00623 [Candidatus Izimaplasma bacterium HR1]